VSQIKSPVPASMPIMLPLRSPMKIVPSAYAGLVREIELAMPL
jgi:hypothetical protein